MNDILPLPVLPPVTGAPAASTATGSHDRSATPTEALAVARVVFGRDISTREARWLWRGALGGFYAAGLDVDAPDPSEELDAEPIDIRADHTNSGQSQPPITTKLP